MCLIYNKENSPVGYVADKDITCYKILKYCIYKGKGSDITARLTSPFYNNLYWQIGDEKTAYINLNPLDDVYIIRREKWKGNDSLAATWTGNPNYIGWKRNIGRGWGGEMTLDPSLGCITNGLHSFTGYMNGRMINLLYSGLQYTYPIFRCVIPKGSHYYVSDDAQSYVSDRLRLVAKVEDWQMKFIYPNIMKVNKTNLK